MTELAMTTEGAKLAHETYRHLTTLNSGSILVISTFLIRPDIKKGNIAIIGLACLLISNVLSVLLMFSLSKRVDGRSEVGNRNIDMGQRLALLFFNAGLMFAAGFASSNFY